jgi:hypothetical protein
MLASISLKFIISVTVLVDPQSVRQRRRCGAALFARLFSALTCDTLSVQVISEIQLAIEGRAVVYASDIDSFGPACA